MPSVDLREGGKLAYGDTGSGPPLILVHGSPGDGRSWSRVIPCLTERYRVLTPDLPGYGGSDPLTCGAHGQTAAMGSAIGALIETCCEPVRLCGHSYGGNVALHAAVSHADLVHSLMLFEPVFFRALDLAGEKQMFEPAAHFFAAYADKVTGGEPAAVSEMIDYWFGPGHFARLPQPTQSFLIIAAPKNGADVRATFLEQITIEQLASVKKPVTVVCGGASPPVAPAIARTLVKLMLLAEFQSIRGANHGMLDDHAHVVAELILARDGR